MEEAAEGIVALCRRCHRETRLTAARQRTRNHICNRCANVARDADVARYLSRKLADTLRRRGVPRPYPGVTFVRAVMARCGERSVLSNEAADDARGLCVVLRDPARGFVVDNAALVTSRECSALSRARNDTISTRLMDCTE